MSEIVALAGLFGLLIGSFLNVCIWRWPRDLSVVWPGSHCTACGHGIDWFDNVPVLSYLILGGRCRHCLASCSWRYPLVELLTGVAFAAAAWVYGPTLPAVKLALFAALQIGLVFADLETRLLPDQFTVGGAVIGFALAFFAPPQPILPGFVWGPLGGVLEALIGAAVAAGGLWLIGEVYARVRHREGLGFGDVKMVAMIAAFLGLGPTLATLLMASLVGSIGGVIWIYVLKKGTATYEIPFASFLGGAALVAGFIYR